MKTKKVNRNGENILIRRTLNGVETFNTTAYNRLGTHKFEYSIEDIPVHAITRKVRNAYYNSPWLNISKFKYKNAECIVNKIAIVYDAGYVLKVCYTNNKGYFYDYIKNINSLKHLKLLKLSDIEIIA